MSAGKSGSNARSGPLQGIRIIDLTSMLSGPWATMILADQGADVIKVEEPRAGDHTRSYGNRRNGFSASFLNLNRNKRSVTIDLKTPQGVKLVKQLAATADVLVQNFRPGVVERLGVDDDKVTLEAEFIGDLNADSLDIVEVVMALEQEFELEIQDDEVESMRTVGDAVSYIEERIG